MQQKNQTKLIKSLFLSRISDQLEPMNPSIA